MTDARAAAQGRWRDLLPELGVDPASLARPNRKCPVCPESRDSFSFLDTDGKGTYHCRKGHSGDGFDLLMEIHGWDFKKAKAEVLRVLGSVADKPKRERKKPDHAKTLNAVYRASKPVHPGCVVDTYLKARGLPVLPPSLRYHSNLELFDAGKNIGTYPAMLGMIRDAAGKAVGIHRTYLEGDRKASVESPKRYLTKAPLQGCAVRLWPATDAVALAEGIESAVAASVLSGLPAWATIDALRMEQIELPKSIKRVVIWADNDETTEYAGQASAYAAAKRLTREGRKVTVHISPIPGFDPLDELNLRQRAKR